MDCVFGTRRSPPKNAKTLAVDQGFRHNDLVFRIRYSLETSAELEVRLPARRLAERLLGVKAIAKVNSDQTDCRHLHPRAHAQRTLQR